MMSADQRQVVIGSILGDGGLIIGKTAGANCRLAITQGHKQKAYLEYKTQLLGDTVAPAGIRPRKVAGYSKLPGFVMQTRSLPELTELRRLVYPEGTKRIGSWIYELEPLGLAIWYMDDGSGGLFSQRYFSTHCFTYDEQIYLQSFLTERFNVDTRIKVDRRTHHYFLDVLTPATSQLFRIIKPFIPEGMLYKLPRRMMEERACEVCSTMFTPRPPNKTRCSPWCAKTGAKRRRHPRIQKFCAKCGKEFQYNHLLERYCSECITETDRQRNRTNRCKKA